VRCITEYEIPIRERRGSEETPLGQLTYLNDESPRGK